MYGPLLLYFNEDRRHKVNENKFDLIKEFLVSVCVMQLN